MEGENLQTEETKVLQGPSFQFLSLEKLHESPFNPRRWFNEAVHAGADRKCPEERGI